MTGKVLVLWGFVAFVKGLLGGWGVLLVARNVRPTMRASRENAVTPFLHDDCVGRLRSTVNA